MFMAVLYVKTLFIACETDPDYILVYRCSSWECVVVWRNHFTPARERRVLDIGSGLYFRIKITQLTLPHINLFSEDYGKPNRGILTVASHFLDVFPGDHDPTMLVNTQTWLDLNRVRSSLSSQPWVSSAWSRSVPNETICRRYFLLVYWRLKPCIPSARDQTQHCSSDDVLF